MDLRYTAEDEAFRAQVRAWLEENAPREPLRTVAREEGLAPQALRGRLPRHGLAEGVRRPERAPDGAGDRRRGDGARERAGRGQRAGLGLVGPTIIHHGTEEQKQRYVRNILTATRSGASSTPSRTRGPTWPRCSPAPRSTATSSSSTGRRSGPAARMKPTGASCWRAPTATRRSTRASPTSSSTCTRPASRCGR